NACHADSLTGLHLPGLKAEADARGRGYNGLQQAFPGQLRTNLRKAGTQIEPLPVYLVTNQAVGGENLFPFHRIAVSGKDRIPVEGFLLTWVSPIACKQ